MSEIIDLQKLPIKSAPGAKDRMVMVNTETHEMSLSLPGEGSGGGSGSPSLTVDSELNAQSTNPIQNKAVTEKFEAVNSVQDRLYKAEFRSTFSVKRGMYHSADFNRCRLIDAVKGDTLIIHIYGSVQLSNIKGSVWFYYSDGKSENMGGISGTQEYIIKKNVEFVGLGFDALETEDVTVYCKIIGKGVSDLELDLNIAKSDIKNLGGLHNSSFKVKVGASKSHSSNFDRVKVDIKKGDGFYISVNGDASVIDSHAYWAYKNDGYDDCFKIGGGGVNENVKFIASDDIEYIGVSLTTTSELPLSYSLNVITDESVLFNSMDLKELQKNEFLDYGGFGRYYENEIDTIVNKIIDKRAGSIKRFSFLHISDPHGQDTTEISKFLDLSPARFIVNTGDLVVDKYTDHDIGSAPFYNAVKCALVAKKPVYLTLGNHDCVMSPSLNDRYKAFIEPLNSHNNMPLNMKTYYSVDYAGEGIKCIFLDPNDGYDDCRPFGNVYGKFAVESIMSKEQIDWFVAELKKASADNLDVCVFTHVSFNPIKEPIKGWYDYQVQVCYNLDFLPKIIDAWTTGKSISFTHNEQSYQYDFPQIGNFVAWFTGHTHYDSCGWHKDYPNQFCVTIQRPLSYSYIYDSTVKNPNFNYIANYVTIDTKTKHLSIMRLGSDLTIYGERREPYSIIYKRDYLDKSAVYL